MSSDLSFKNKSVNPIRCNEKPWDLWVSEIGHASPSHEDETAASLLAQEAGKSGAARRSNDMHSKSSERQRHKRARVNRLKYNQMNLHGIFPQHDNLNAVVCHMCGMTFKCTAAHRHLLEYHASSAEPILPPPPPAPTVKLKSSHSRSKHKKDPPLIPPMLEVVTTNVDTTPTCSNTAPIPRIVLPQSEVQYISEEPSTSSMGEVQVCVKSGELPVVSIQDTADLSLGDNLTDDIFAIMNSEGIGTAEDLSEADAWKIIRDIGNMQDMNMLNTDTQLPQEIYPAPVENVLNNVSLSEDLANIQFSSNSSMVPAVVDTSILTAQPVSSAPTSTAKSSRSKTSKTKFHLREYDPNKHCGVVTPENQKPCTRSLTCKAHTLSLRRTVEGRSKPFDTLLAEHRAMREANAAAAASAANAIVSKSMPPPTVTQTPPSVPISIAIPPSLVNTSLDLAAFNGLTEEQQVNEIYTSLLSVEDPNAVLPDTSSLTSLLSQVPTDQFLLPDDAELPTDVPILSISSPVETQERKKEEPMLLETPPTVVPTEVFWYTNCPRPLAMCTFNASHAGGAITIGKRFATVRSGIKSSLSRSGKGSSSMNNYFFSQNSLSLSKTVHMNNANKTSKPEVRKLILTHGVEKETFREVGYSGSDDVRHTLNGHLVSGKRSILEESEENKRARPSLLRNSMKVAKHSGQADMLELSFMLDPLMADEKC